MAGSIAQEAGELVDRARQGDQNAMGMLIEIRRSAEKGSPRAKQALSAAMRYIKANPFDRFGAECLCKRAIESNIGEEILDTVPQVGDVFVCAVMLANAEDQNLLHKAKSVGSSLTGRERTLFFYTIRNGRQKNALRGLPLTGKDHDVVVTGRAFAWAMALQKVRLPDSRISEFSPNVGWELGE